MLVSFIKETRMYLRQLEKVKLNMTMYYGKGDNMEVTAENIKRLRQINKLTQVKFAEIFHISDSLVSKWETGKKIPNTEVLIQISNYFGITIEDILG